MAFRDVGMAKSRGEKKRSPPSQLKEAIVLIPIMFNDGTKVPRATPDAIYDEAYAAFNGWTLEGTVTGAYRMQSGSKAVERLRKLSIILPKSELSALEEMIRRWGKMLRQEAMLLKVSESEVKFILSGPEEGQS
jgi:hypothetical protein